MQPTPQGARIALPNTLQVLQVPTAGLLRKVGEYGQLRTREDVLNNEALSTSNFPSLRADGVD
eukprot:CAMPEP_0180701104 /NCGR_PEP_ID=MMETSP1038_2-20121128/5428_1 /TAXON_ID=632150 /ORGANISM="Azadinium spinosum, Strain 3D9" /LENGTH=62 /DNA_ID=CAMNT_0022732815 /DNA_START=113 /DNA_END=301 /DNA_ORIENTATION=-